ncbi:unnamed protein product [Dovyalis caffra]|uniref:Secreted protein n=1 Tax=Dovyalis caffra TaxID=77055 RepID=A0AAV1ST54_9ROSI|nr:unnamed protein product [Dovyalis caffra]
MSALVSLLSTGANLAQARIPPPPSLVSTKSPTSQVLWRLESEEQQQKTCVESARDENETTRETDFARRRRCLPECRAATVADRPPRDFVRLKRKGKTKKAAKGNRVRVRETGTGRVWRRRGRRELPSVRSNLSATKTGVRERSKVPIFFRLLPGMESNESFFVLHQQIVS